MTQRKSGEQNVHNGSFTLLSHWTRSPDIMMLKQVQKGFTLIELMIVVAIIGSPS